MHKNPNKMRSINTKAKVEDEEPTNIVTMIERRFAHCGDFESPEIPREPIRQIPTFDE